MDFADWLNNNFYVPREDGLWRIMTEHPEYKGKKFKINIFFTEELYKKFLKEK